MKVELYNHYPAPISFEHQSLTSRLRKVIKELSDASLVIAGSPFLDLDHTEFNLVNDETITDLHSQFMDDPTPTDVITFQHGEVFVSYDTALKESGAREIKLEEELFRYHVHGILHLAGYDDLTTEEYEKMHAIQETLIKRFF